MEWRRGDYLLFTDPARVDVAAVHAYLTRAYWSEGVPIEVVRRAIAGSIPFSVWWDGSALTAVDAGGAVRADVGDTAAGASDERLAAGSAMGASGESLVGGSGTVPQQVAFARAITDRATFAYVADVYVLEAHRGRGLSRWMMEALVAHPDLQGLRRMVLATRDAHGLYAKFGFTPLASPPRWMEKWDPDVYRRR